MSLDTPLWVAWSVYRAERMVEAPRVLWVMWVARGWVGEA